jgi:membrane protease YdiL (CAAX protease family)
VLNEESPRRHTIPVVVCLSVAAPLLLSCVIAPWLMSRLSPSAVLAVFQIYYSVLALLVVIIVCYWERRPLRSIGFRWLTMKEVGLALLAGIVLFALIPALVIVMERVFRIPTQTRMTAVAAQFAKCPIWLLVLLAANAGFVEEIIYRGYCMERLRGLTGRMWPGAVLVLVVFTALHALNGLGVGYVVGVVFPLAALLTGLYLWKRNLTLNIAVHFLTDFLALVLLPLLLPLL